jgi:hypothetical protein
MWNWFSGFEQGQMMCSGHDHEQLGTQQVREIDISWAIIRLLRRIPLLIVVLVLAVAL